MRYRIIHMTINENAINWEDFVFVRYLKTRTDYSERQLWQAKAGDCYALANLALQRFYLLIKD